MTLYRCCQHCYLEADGTCAGSGDGPDTHVVPCDRGGPHVGCPGCDCDPCTGAREATP